MIKDKSLSSKVFDFFLYSMCVVVLIAVLAPVLNIFAVSFSSYDAFARGDVGLLPVEFSTKAYETIIRDGKVLQGLKYSVIYTGLGTLVNILLTVITAYPMSRKEMPFRNAISIFFAFTMFFGGGMIPTFLLVQKLGLYDSIWAMIIPGAMQIYNMIIMRTYFQSIPGELMEAARIDGTNEWQTLWQEHDFQRPGIGEKRRGGQYRHHHHQLCHAVHLHGAHDDYLSFRAEVFCQRRDGRLCQGLIDAKTRCISAFRNRSTAWQLSGRSGIVKTGAQRHWANRQTPN